MKILQQPVKAKRNQIIEIIFDQPVVVRLLSKNMFPKYKNGAKHTGLGGFYEKSPAKFTVPYDGIWHAVIEKGSHSNPINVTGKVNVLRAEVHEKPYFVPDEEVAEIPEVVKETSDTSADETESEDNFDESHSDSDEDLSDEEKY